MVERRAEPALEAVAYHKAALAEQRLCDLKVAAWQAQVERLAFAGAWALPPWWRRMALSTISSCP
jgi:hypothetical protein